MAVSEPFQTLFAVPMTCDSCVNEISTALSHLSGIRKVEAKLDDQLVLVEGTAAPSEIVKTIQATGRDAILRGSGASNSAAVSILESHHSSPTRSVRGLARMVSISPTRTLIDLTVSGVSPGTYRATIRQYGDLSDGAASTGPVWGGDRGRGLLGTLEVGPDGGGSTFFTHDVQVWEAIGHAMVLTRQDEAGGAALRNDGDTLAGIVARSAGIWENDKVVCSCTGKTLWEERRDEVRKGML